MIIIYHMAAIVAASKEYKMMNITVNGADYKVKTVKIGNRGAEISNAARILCKERGIDWLSADIFAAHGEKGRCYAKSTGEVSLYAHG